jgi:sterol desaturase/sphingolipid hydroxylase (fatty acid hydroxylase superfamily)
MGQEPPLASQKNRRPGRTSVSQSRQRPPDLRRVPQALPARHENAALVKRRRNGMQGRCAAFLKLDKPANFTARAARDFALNSGQRGSASSARSVAAQPVGAMLLLFLMVLGELASHQLTPSAILFRLRIEVRLREGENGPIERSKRSKGNFGLMGTLEAIFGKALVQFVLSPYVFFNLLFLGRAVVFTALEVMWPARKLSYLPVVWRDLAAYVFFRSVVLPSGLYLNGIVLDYNLIPASVANLPLAARIAAYFIIADFGHYWVHRLTHTKYFWRVHKWHHSPTYMYWLGGVRSTIPDFFLVNAPYFVAWQLLYISPWWMATGLAVSSILQNDWMHMNVTWRSNWLEWIIVTPRYHHIHHSDDPHFYMKNLGSLFTVWDRLFGTYANPDTVKTGDLSFGTGEKDNPVHVVLGV